MLQHCVMPQQDRTYSPPSYTRAYAPSQSDEAAGVQACVLDQHCLFSSSIRAARSICTCQHTLPVACHGDATIMASSQSSRPCTGHPQSSPNDIPGGIPAARSSLHHFPLHHFSQPHVPLRGLFRRELMHMRCLAGQT